MEMIMNHNKIVSGSRWSRISKSRPLAWSYQYKSALSCTCITAVAQCLHPFMCLFPTFLNCKYNCPQFGIHAAFLDGYSHPVVGCDCFSIQVTESKLFYFPFPSWTSRSVKGTYRTEVDDHSFNCPCISLSITMRSWKTSPTGITMRPPGFNWSISACGISSAAAPTWMALYGAYWGYPCLPSVSQHKA